MSETIEHRQIHGIIYTNMFVALFNMSATRMVAPSTRLASLSHQTAETEMGMETEEGEGGLRGKPPIVDGTACTRIPAVRANSRMRARFTSERDTLFDVHIKRIGCNGTVN